MIVIVQYIFSEKLFDCLQIYRLEISVDRFQEFSIVVASKDASILGLS